MSEQKAVPEIPEDLREMYESSKLDTTMFVGSQIRQLIRRITNLEAELAELRATDHTVQMEETADATAERKKYEALEKENADLKAQVARLSAPVSDADGWLIERGGLCIGMECNTVAWVTFTHPQAIRFSRKQDAENMLTSLRSFGHGTAFHDCIVTGHTWLASRTTPPAKEQP